MSTHTAACEEAQGPRQRHCHAGEDVAAHEDVGGERLRKAMLVLFKCHAHLYSSLLLNRSITLQTRTH